MKIFVGADHRGFKMKEMAKSWVSQMGYEVEDLGAATLDPKDDYTTFAESVALSVARNPESMGILMCGSGVGVDVMANKFDGVRSSIGKEPDQVVAGRHDDNMNVLVIAADFTDEGEARAMIKSFLGTKFEGAPRHKRRLAAIERVEKNN